MSESVPSSVTGFAHWRPRADSVASFTYFQEDEESPQWPDDQAIVEDEDDEPEASKPTDEDLSLDLESDSICSQRWKSSGHSKTSVEDPLLNWHDAPGVGGIASDGARFSQKIYVVTEDLTVVVAGFTTNSLGFLLYVGICVFSFGLGFLVLRWLPRWRIRLVGSAKALQSCDWVVIEVRVPPRRRKSEIAAKMGQNQWGEFTVQSVVKISYGYAASTVFGLPQKSGCSPNYDDEDDPVMTQLRFLDYRYIRFCFHPSKDRFVLCSDWKDPNWSDVRSIRAGLDSEERYRREQVFGMNRIDIQQKSVPQLLVDEVSMCLLCDVLREPNLRRLSILSTFFKLQASSFGLLTSTITMPSVSFLYQLSALRPL